MIQATYRKAFLDPDEDAQDSLMSDFLMSNCHTWRMTFWHLTLCISSFNVINSAVKPQLVTIKEHCSESVVNEQTAAEPNITMTIRHARLSY